MAKKIISTLSAPKAIGPYSQAVQAGQLLFVSGQIALDPATQELITGDVAEQTKRVMANLQAILAEAGADFDSVVKCTIFMKDLGQFGVVNEIYGSFFKGEPPARATVEVSALPKDVDVEIDAIAHVANGIKI